VVLLRKKGKLTSNLSMERHEVGVPELKLPRQGKGIPKKVAYQTVEKRCKFRGKGKEVESPSGEENFKQKKEARLVYRGGGSKGKGLEHGEDITMKPLIPHCP